MATALWLQSDGEEIPDKKALSLPNNTYLVSLWSSGVPLLLAVPFAFPGAGVMSSSVLPLHSYTHQEKDQDSPVFFSKITLTKPSLDRFFGHQPISQKF